MLVIINEYGDSYLFLISGILSELCFRYVCKINIFVCNCLLLDNNAWHDILQNTVQLNSLCV